MNRLGNISDRRFGDLARVIIDEARNTDPATALEISRATVADDSDEEDNETAYSELVEYLRVAAQLTYEELAEFRSPADNYLRTESATLH